MATAINGKRDVIRFEPDHAVTVELKYATGRAVSGTHGPQVMFTTSENQVFFLDPEVAESLENLNLKRGERVRIAKLKRGGRIEWDMQRIPQPVETSAKSSDNISDFCKNGAGAKAGSESGAPGTMADCFRAALDAIAEAQDYSNKKGIGIAFTSDNVTSAALSAYIAKARETGRAA